MCMDFYYLLHCYFIQFSLISENPLKELLCVCALIELKLLIFSHVFNQSNDAFP